MIWRPSSAVLHAIFLGALLTTSPAVPNDKGALPVVRSTRLDSRAGPFTAMRAVSGKQIDKPSSYALARILAEIFTGNSGPLQHRRSLGSEAAAAQKTTDEETDVRSSETSWPRHVFALPFCDQLSNFALYFVVFMIFVTLGAGVVLLLICCRGLRRTAASRDSPSKGPCEGGESVRRIDI